MCQRFTGLNQIFTCPGQLDRGFVAAYVFYAEISILKEKGKDMVIYSKYLSGENTTQMRTMCVYF